MDDRYDVIKKKLIVIFFENQISKLKEIFQEVRRHIVAEWQNIVYSEFLPNILGSELMAQFDLQTSNSSLYDSRVLPSIFTEFSTAAYRFGHSMIQNQVNFHKFLFVDILRG